MLFSWSVLPITNPRKQHVDSLEAWGRVMLHATNVDLVDMRDSSNEPQRNSTAALVQQIRDAPRQGHRSSTTPFPNGLQTAPLLVPIVDGSNGRELFVGLCCSRATSGNPKCSCPPLQCSQVEIFGQPSSSGRSVGPIWDLAGPPSQPSDWLLPKLITCHDMISQSL